MKLHIFLFLVTIICVGISTTAGYQVDTWIVIYDQERTFETLSKVNDWKNINAFGAVCALLFGIWWFLQTIYYWTEEEKRLQ